MGICGEAKAMCSSSTSYFVYGYISGERVSLKCLRGRECVVKLVANEETKTPDFERYTIFSAVLEAMNERKQRKSRFCRFLNKAGIRK